MPVIPASRPLRCQNDQGVRPKEAPMVARAVATLTAAAPCLRGANAGKRFWPRRIRDAQKWNVTSERDAKLKQGKPNIIMFGKGFGCRRRSLPLGHSAHD